MFKLIFRAVCLVISVFLFNSAANAKTDYYVLFSDCISGSNVCETVEDYRDYELVRAVDKKYPNGFYFILDKKDKTYYNIFTEDTGNSLKYELRLDESTNKPVLISVDKHGKVVKAYYVAAGAL